MTISGIDTSIPPSSDGCVECAELDGWWVHLRRCVECGHIGCCDDSLGQHATGHFQATAHRYMRSYEPGEDWYWDFVAKELVDGPALAPPQAHPEDQPAPGPAGRVPEDWRAIVLARRKER